MSIYYGLTSKQQLRDCIRASCQAIKPDNVPQAMELIIGTACAETLFGTLRDSYEKQGRGWPQFDEIRFKDIRDYLLFHNPEMGALIKKEFGIDMILIGFGQALDHGPLLCAVLCRVGYYMKPEPFPAVGDHYGQALYYKKHWNSSLGKSSPKQYMQKLIHAQ